MSKFVNPGARPRSFVARMAMFAGVSALSLVFLLGARSPHPSYGHGTVD